MKKLLSLCFLLVALTARQAFAVDDINLKLSDAKLIPAEGVSAELVGYNEGEGKIFYYAPGKAEWRIKVVAEGEYTLYVKASCDAALKENAKFQVSLDGKASGDEVTLSAESEKEYKVTLKLMPGEFKLAIAFTNDVYKAGEYDRNLYVHGAVLKRN